MPVYDFECDNEACKRQWEEFLQSFDSPNPACASCSGSSQRIWGITQRSGYQIFPYTTKHLTGQPLEIKSPAHLKQLEKKHGVRLRDDAAYVDEQYRGYSRKNGQQYDGGSGRGMPGCWV